jgi:hypothetical protein
MFRRLRDCSPEAHDCCKRLRSCAQHSLCGMLYGVRPLSGAMGMDDWAAKEFGGAKLGDGRLTNRLIKIASAFAERPTASIPGACSGWVETQAAYRFFDQASEKKQGSRVGRHPDAAPGMHHRPHAPASGGLVPARHDRTRLQRPAHRGTGAAQLRGSARLVPASHLRCDPGPGTAGGHGCLDLGTRIQGCRRKPSWESSRAPAG